MEGAISIETQGRAEAEGRRGSDGLRLLAYIAALMCLGAGGSLLAPQVRPPSERAQQNGAGWEARRLLAQMLWLKTHAVMHAGVEERNARPGEEESRAEEIRQHDEHENGEHEEHGEHSEHPGHAQDDHEAHVLVIPPKKDDFRGILGDLERATKPYAAADGQLYSKDGDQTVPFYRLMTWADPHFIQGYTVGAMWINRAGKYADRAIEFLKEGEQANPDSFEIQTELGHYYLVYKKEHPTAERYLRRALLLLPRNRELSEMEKDARSDAYRWLALSCRDSGKPREAVRIAREGLQVIGEDGTLLRIIRKNGS